MAIIAVGRRDTAVSPQQVEHGAGRARRCHRRDSGLPGTSPRARAVAGATPRGAATCRCRAPPRSPPLVRGLRSRAPGAACSVASSCVRPTNGLRARSSTWAPASVLRAEPHDLVGTHGGRLPAHRYGRDLLEMDVLPDQAGRSFTAEQHARRCVLMKCLDRQGEVPDDWLTTGLPRSLPRPSGPYADPDTLPAAPPPGRTPGRRQPLVQPPRGQHGSPGVILVGHRGAKEWPGGAYRPRGG